MDYEQAIADHSWVEVTTSVNSKFYAKVIEHTEVYTKLRMEVGGTMNGDPIEETVDTVLPNELITDVVLVGEDSD